MDTPELQVRWLDGPPTRVYENIAKATLTCHSEDPWEDMKKIDDPGKVEMWGKEFDNGHELAKWLTNHIKELGHHAMLEFSGQFNFLVTDCSRGLTHEQVRSRIGISYAQRSTRYVGTGDYSIPPQLDDGDKAKYRKALDDLANVRNDLEARYPKDVTRQLLPIATHAPIVIGFNSVRSLLYELNLRCCLRAHWEIRYMANEIRRLCRKEYPDLFAKAGAPCEVVGYCKEGDTQCEERKGKVPTHKEVMDAWKRTGKTDP